MNDLSMTSKTTRSSIYSYSSKISLDGVTRSSYSRGDQNSTDPPMLEAKINRKRAEGDLQILTNR